MSRPSLNSNLTALARAAGELRFDDSPSLRVQFGMLLGKYKNCYKVPRGFEVKQYLYQQQRTIGVFKPEFEYHAARYADLVIVRFWGFRKTSRKITDADLNFSLDVTNSQVYPTAVKILDDVEIFLKQRFQLIPREPEQPSAPITHPDNPVFTTTTESVTVFPLFSK